MKEAPLFTLADIPDDWEIDLDPEFVQFLDRLNRPWKYNPDGSFAPKSRHGNRQSAIFWEAGEYNNAHERHLITEGYKKRHNFYEKLWGYHRYHDAHVARYGYIKLVDRGNWILKSELEVLRVAFVTPLTDDDVEQLVRGVRKSGCNPHNNILRVPRLPIRADKWWAWLIGYYFSSGCVYHRKRYYLNSSWNETYIQFKAHEPVIPRILRVIDILGYSKTIVQPRRSNRVAEGKDKGLGTTIRAVVHVGSPIYLVLKTFGIQADIADKPLLGGGSRCVNPKVPEWIKDNDEFMEFFIEAYVNGTRGASSLSPVISGSFSERRPHLSIYIRCNGAPEKYVVQFLRDIEAWFTKRGVKGIVRQNIGYEIKGMVQWQLEFFSKESTAWFRRHIEMFAKAEIRARLFVMSAAENDAILYEALRELHAPVNVVLGLIVEQPLTYQQIKQMLQMQAQGVRNSIQCLVRKGLIVKEQDKYRYEPTAYVTRLIQQKRTRTAKLCRQMQVLREKLLFQCQSCGKVYTRQRTVCGRCGSQVEPIERRKVLRSIVANSVLLSSTEQKLVQQINQRS